jgi:hypothetical protein
MGFIFIKDIRVHNNLLYLAVNSLERYQVESPTVLIEAKPSFKMGSRSHNSDYFAPLKLA